MNTPTTEVAKRPAILPTTREHTTLEYLTMARGAFYRQMVDATGSEQAAKALLAEFLNQGRRLPDLHACTTDSLGYAMMRAAALRLNPAIPNEYWLIPRNLKVKVDGRDTWIKSAEPQYGYGGLRKLVLRSPEVIDRDEIICTAYRRQYHEPEIRVAAIPADRLGPLIKRLEAEGKI